MTIELGIVLGLLAQIAVFAFGYGMLWAHIGNIRKQIENGLTAKVGEIHDDVLMIKARCPLCEIEKD